MGGCRCHFRDCHVNNTKFPRMHFFRFPFKDVTRYKRWQKMAKLEHMEQYTDVRRKNTCICARHFRIEYFMNYKMDRLAPNAVPTLMRLSEDKALDYEMDIENGVLVTIEKTTLKHLIAPSNFESPLSLENDKIAREKLNELEGKLMLQTPKVEIVQNLPGEVYVNSGSCNEYIVPKTTRNLVKSVEIIEAVQVRAPNMKRVRETNEGMYDNAAGVSNKKCRILNATNSSGRKLNETTIVMTSGSLQTDSFNLNSEDYDIEEVEDVHELDNIEEGHLLLTSEEFITINNSHEDDNDIEFVEKPNDEYDMSYDIPANDTDNIIVQSKSQQTIDSNILEDKNKKIASLENEITDLRDKLEKANTLQIKCSILEKENAELNVTAKENEDLNKKLLALQMENTRLQKFVKDNKVLNDKLVKYTEENKKLQNEITKCDILKAELLSKQEEIDEMENQLETLKNNELKEKDLRKQFDLELETLKKDNLTKEEKLTEELNNLKEKLTQTQQQLKTKEAELKDVQLDLNSLKSEKETLKQRHEELQQTLNNIQNNFEIKQNDFRTLKTDYDNVQQKYLTMEQKYWKLQALQNQEATVTTSNKSATPTNVSTPAVSANSLSKAQLFNGIKRYLSASMVSLLRMEMFGSSEREWKNDERQVAVDILRLGDTVYKYFTDEWRFRLPALRDVRNWLSQSEQMMDDEEDL